MLQKTRGIVLRPVKYGDTSLVVTIFTEAFGVQAFLVRGVRVTSKGSNKAAYFQPGMLLDMVVYIQPSKNIQQLREYNAACFYMAVHQDIIRNSILMFSAEILLRLMPPDAPMAPLFVWSWEYFQQLDVAPPTALANFPLLFLVHIADMLGYELMGAYSEATPYLNVPEGGFSAHPPSIPPYATQADSLALSQIIMGSVEEQKVVLNGEQRIRLIDWYIAFLQQHSQHMANIRSLAVLRTILYA